MKDQQAQKKKEEEEAARLAKELELKNSSPILDEVFKSADISIRENCRILILGATGSGKTSFLNLLAHIGKVNEARDPSFLT